MALSIKILTICDIYAMPLLKCNSLNEQHNVYRLLQGDNLVTQIIAVLEMLKMVRDIEIGLVANFAILKLLKRKEIKCSWIYLGIQANVNVKYFIPCVYSIS